MLKNYFRVAVRHLLRQPSYAALNIFGLTIGIVSCLLIILYLNNELSYDTYHKNADRLYRISSQISEPDDSFNWAVTQYPLARTVKEEFPDVDNYVRFIGSGRTRFRKGDISYFIDDSWIVDSTVFELFTFDFLMGDPNTALSAPNSMVLAKSEADKIFKGENPMGQTLETDNFSYTVRGVYADQPKNSHIIANAMTSISTNERLVRASNWGGFSIFTYILLNPTADPLDVEERLNSQIIEKYVATIFDQFDIKIVYDLLNVQDIHLYSEYEGEPEPLGNIEYIYIFAAVAVFLVFIACINYMNLATARSIRRALEVGVRKVMGANRKSLIGQFMSESILIAFVSLILSVILLLIAIPLINKQLGLYLDSGLLLEPQIIFTLIGLLIFVGVISGSYPAFYLSAYSPISALRGGASNRSGSVWLRRILVGIQFAISIFMLASTFIIYDQMSYIRNADLGFDKEQVITFSMNQPTRERWPVLRNRLMENPNVTKASTASTTPGNGYSKNLMDVEKNDGVMEEYGIDLFAIDYDYFSTLNVEIIEGRDFSYDFVTDTSHAVIVNEAMVERLAWDEPIGKRFQFDGDSTHFRRVVGVAKNFHHLSLYNPIEPLMFFPNLNNGNAIVKIEGNIQNTLQSIESEWQELFPNIPFEYRFLDQEFQEQYESDELRGSLFLGFSVMMIIIASLGLLGLASFIAEQRTKEISIRKVLGAEVGGLITLLVKDFIYLVLIGAVPAFVAGYWIMNSWLENFEYHIDIGFGLFAVVLLIIMFITAATTGYHAYKAAVSNPSDNLKYE